MVHSNLEAIKSLAMQQAETHNLRYNIVLLNPDADGKFSQEAGSSYEFVHDTYFDKTRDNVIRLFTTDDLFIRKEIKTGRTQNFKVVTMAPSDIPACVSICDINFKQLGYSYDVKPELEAQFLKPKTFYTPEYVVFKYDSKKFGSKTLGVAGFSNSGWDSSIFGMFTCYVEPVFHRCGIGKLLTEERLKRINDAGGEMAFASTQAPWHLERFGFNTINLMKGNWVLMQKVLN